MNTLRIVQTTIDGRRKSWKLNSSSALQTFGSSRKADIVSIDKSVESFQSVIEYRDKKWHYITFALDKNPSEKILDENQTVSLGSSTLQFEIIQKTQDLLSNIERINTNGSKTKQLIIVSRQNSLIGTYVKEPNEAFKLFTDGHTKKLNLPASEKWSSQQFAEFNVKFKNISTEDLKEYEKTSNQKLNKKDKAAVFAVLGFTGLLILTALLTPKNTEVEPVAQTKTSTTIIVKNEFKKRRHNQTQQALKQEITKAADSGQTGGGKASALLKGAVGLRISQLIGKVSATEARTKNVLVSTSGVKASEVSSGRALAAIGKVESSGRNWSGEATTKGAGVSTAGIGGGNGVKGLGGGLAQGKTGSGGVGLIEEESEIVGGLDREIIAQYIKTQLGQILYCYERQLSANPNLFGKIAVKFTIAGTGQVETQSINDSTMKNSSVESCILSKVSKWKFPEPKGGTKVLVTYPFLFKSTI